MVHYCAELREAFNQILLVLVPLFFGQLSGHVGSHCIDHSQQGRCLVVSDLQSINREGGLLVLQHIDRRKCCSLSLCSSLSLRDYIIPITTIPQPYNATDIPLQKLDLLQLANPASLLNRRQLHRHVPISLIDL